jgi:hypothetical protein
MLDTKCFENNVLNGISFENLNPEWKHFMNLPLYGTTILIRNANQISGETESYIKSMGGMVTTDTLNDHKYILGENLFESNIHLNAADISDLFHCPLFIDLESYKANMYKLSTLEPVKNLVI